MICHLKLRYVGDDIIYMLWTALFLICYMFLAGGISSFASTMFINIIYSKDTQK